MRVILIGTTLLGVLSVNCLVHAATPPQVTATSVDPQFTQPYVDKDEWRDTPVRHRYIHGGFRGH